MYWRVSLNSTSNPGSLMRGLQSRSELASEIDRPGSRMGCGGGGGLTKSATVYEQKAKGVGDAGATRGGGR